MTRADRQMLFTRPTIAIAVLLCILGGAPAAAEIAVTPERVARALERRIAAQGPWKMENIEAQVAPFQTIYTSVAPSLRVLRPINGIRPGPQSIFVALDVAGREHSRFWVRATIRVYEEVVVTSQPLPFREVIDPGDVRLERRDVSSLHARPFYRVDDVVGQQAARRIPINETLTEKLVDRPTLMRRGSAVMMVYETGSLHVETPGIAEENGKAGEMIQVKNSSSGKLLRGIVLDGRKVRVN